MKPKNTRRKPCATPYCRNLARRNRGNFCCTCQSRKWRVRHPIRFLWHNLKAHAKERRHACDLSYEDFEKFCLKTKYHELKGLYPNSLTVDRIDETKGYSKGNIRVLEHECNVRRNYVPYFKQNGIKTDAHELAASWKPNVEEEPW